MVFPTPFLLIKSNSCLDRISCNCCNMHFVIPKIDHYHLGSLSLSLSQWANTICQMWLWVCHRKPVGNAPNEGFFPPSILLYLVTLKIDMMSMMVILDFFDIVYNLNSNSCCMVTGSQKMNSPCKCLLYMLIECFEWVTLLFL